MYKSIPRATDAFCPRKCRGDALESLSGVCFSTRHATSSRALLIQSLVCHILFTAETFSEDEVELVTLAADGEHGISARFASFRSGKLFKLFGMCSSSNVWGPKEGRRRRGQEHGSGEETDIPCREKNWPHGPSNILFTETKFPFLPLVQIHSQKKGLCNG